MTPSRMLQQKKNEDFPTAFTGWWHLAWRSSPDRHLCIHEQSQPHFLCSYPCPYSLDLLTSTLDNAPTSYYEMLDVCDISRFPRCDDNHQWWRHPWSGWCFWTLNMNYGLLKHLYSLTLSIWTKTELYNEHQSQCIQLAQLISMKVFISIEQSQ